MTDINQNKHIDITGVSFDLVNLEQAAATVSSLVLNRENELSACSAYVCTPNAEIMMSAQKDTLLKQILNEASLVIADGMGVVLAAQILGYGKIPRVPGFDLTRKLLLEPEQYPFSYYFLGGKPGVAETASQKLTALNPSIRINGFHDGYFTQEDDAAIIEEINRSGADILLVALGSPKQEKWMYENREALKIPVCMGVGGSLDVFAGTAKLAPDFFRKNGLEWLYRLYKEPWRFKRMLRLPQYVLFSIYWKLFKK